MATKLTLSIDEAVIRDAKVYAQQSGRSVSELVETYLKALTRATNKKKPKLPPHLKKWQGAFKPDGDQCSDGWELVSKREAS